MTDNVVRLKPRRMLVELSEDELRAIIREEQPRELPVEERLLNVEEAATMIGASKDWIYHNLKKLPFVRRVGRKMLRFSYREILRWIETKKQ